MPETQVFEVGATTEGGLLDAVLAAGSADHLHLALAVRDADGRIVDVNAAYLRLFGARHRHDLIGTTPSRIAPMGNPAALDGQYRDGIPLAGEHRLQRVDGGTIWGRVHPVEISAGDHRMWLEQIEDRTELREERRDGRRRGRIDELTGLPNRLAFTEELAAAIAAGGAAVLVVDVDRFKVLNESFGHTAGDAVLQQVGERIREALPADHVVARFGGDEFGVLVPSDVPVFEAVAIANRILDAVDGTVVIDGTELFTTASVGIAFPQGDDDAEDVLRHAEVALYGAKARGTNRHEVFDETSRARVAEQSRFESELRRAVDENQIEVWYQPEVDLLSGDIVGGEALVRWDHPSRGIIPANEFIRLAEETGQIHPIGQKVLTSAAETFASWAADPSLPELVARINLSPRELEQPMIVERIAATISMAGIPPSRVCLEVTESALMIDVDEAMHRLERLSALGVEIAIDDFGTGFSSLAYLRRFPVDVLKIDRSFVNRIESDDRPIVQAIIDLGRRLDLGVVAEGVETEAQRRALIELGCSRGQGWLFSPAVDAREFGRLLRAGNLAPGRSAQLGEL